MRAGLLVVAAIFLVAFITVAFVLPQRSAAQTKDAALALIAGADAAKRQVSAAAEKSASLTGSGKDVRLTAQRDPTHGELKWLVSENGEIRGWNGKNALEVAMRPSLEGGKVRWTCRGFPLDAMPPQCSGRP